MDAVAHYVPVEVCASAFSWEGSQGDVLDLHMHCLVVSAERGPWLVTYDWQGPVGKKRNVCTSSA